MTSDSDVPEHHNKIRDTTTQAILQARDIHGDVHIVVGSGSGSGSGSGAGPGGLDEGLEVEPVPVLGETECVEFVRNHLGGEAGVVTYVDVDGLLGINQVYGRGAGDLVLETCGRLVRQVCDGIGVVCRLRGDQYVIAEAGVRPDLHLRANQVLAAIRAHDWSTIAPDLHVSVTAASADRGYGEDLPTLILRAIMGVRMAKRHGKNRAGVAPHYLPELKGTPVERWDARVEEMSRYLSD
ncbi:GGDEF domain-containing protein [Lentzea alba]|uniref:GGDEF domain-containing protein n=1 Tax=Lentzea alba TaxID=2714351 RepID=UPI0039BF7946